MESKILTNVSACVFIAPIHKIIYELSSASLRNWNDGFWNIGMVG